VSTVCSCSLAHRKNPHERVLLTPDPSPQINDADGSGVKVLFLVVTKNAESLADFCFYSIGSWNEHIT
jgi:hypothetical protein